MCDGCLYHKCWQRSTVDGPLARVKLTQAIFDTDWTTPALSDDKYYMGAQLNTHTGARAPDWTGSLTGIWWGMVWGLGVIALLLIGWIRLRGPASLASQITVPQPADRARESRRASTP